jgi:molybdopterin synthase catalytic subunit
MYTMYEALARDRMRESRAEAHQRRTMLQLTAVRRWQRLQRRAEVAEQRVNAAQRRNALTAV